MMMISFYLFSVHTVWARILSRSGLSTVSLRASYRDTTGYRCRAAATDAFPMWLLLLLLLLRSLHGIAGSYQSTRHYAVRPAANSRLASGRRRVKNKLYTAARHNSARVHRDANCRHVRPSVSPSDLRINIAQRMPHIPLAVVGQCALARPTNEVYRTVRRRWRRRRRRLLSA